MKKKQLIIRYLSALLLVAMLLSACAPEATVPSTAPSGSTQPSVPVQSTTPIEPSASTEPTVPTDPTDPTVPTDPTNPTDPTISACQHRDDDANERCDTCGTDVTVEIDFYAFNDLHGVFADAPGQPGLDELTTYLKNAYADDTAYEILLSSGDMWQGTAESSLNKGALMTEWMNHMGFVSMTLGNHEYDWGSSYIVKNAALANFPFLGINITDGNVTQSYCQPSVVVERGGMRIGIIGAIGNYESSISGEFNAKLDFASSSLLTTMVKNEATRLRTEEGCDFIVYSVHDDTSTYDASLSNGYVDLVFEAHTHRSYVNQDSYGVYHLQGGGENDGLSYAKVEYNLITGDTEVSVAKNIYNSVYSSASLADDPIVEALLSQYFPNGSPNDAVLGQNSDTRNSDFIVKLVAQLYLQKGIELWGDQYDVVLGGGYLKLRAPYRVYSGGVTYASLASILPFDNDIVLCEVTGKQLKNNLINKSGYTCYYDKSALSNIVDSQKYYIVTDTYTSFYKYNQFKEVARLEGGIYARDLLADYIKAGNWA